MPFVDARKRGFFGIITTMLRPWLKFFRVVNLPTVPGDVLVGVASVAAFAASRPLERDELAWCAVASATSVLLYMFGLADNDIVGAKEDTGRPIADGEISLHAAKTARAACLVAAFALLIGGGMLVTPSFFVLDVVHSSFIVAIAIAASCAAYNRTKSPFLMGLCRGLNVLLGAAAYVPLWLMPRLLECAPKAFAALCAVVVLWTAYIAFVTKYSEGEESDPALRGLVGQLVGAIVYLQLGALVVFGMINHGLNALLVVGAVLLLVLRILRQALPKVSAS